MLLCERKTLPRGPGWHFEIKYDGYRLLASTGAAPQLKSRNGANATIWFPELVEALAALPAGSIIDGEVCVLDDIGRSDFERLHARARRKGWYRGADPVAYCVFDLLVGKGKDLRGAVNRAPQSCAAAPTGRAAVRAALCGQRRGWRLAVWPRTGAGTRGGGREALRFNVSGR